MDDMSQVHSAVQLVSFGYKYGAAPTADVLLDVRFLPNPYWVQELRDQNGLIPAVAGYVLSKPEAKKYVGALTELVALTSLGFASDDKGVMTVVVGCTGGKHRSVSVVAALAQQLQLRGITVFVAHRDLGLE
ncbi:MAG: hypothetical protein LBU38_04340 [Propionibacteriaceae bacterium]|jgi:UPF0042 nucleotide-binding protein|nr:hypothetical protein [Propionibacteriaceae bacterium]